MSQGTYTLIRDKYDIEKKIPYLIKQFNDWDYSDALVIKLERYQNPRSLSQNALSHIWYREIAQEMIARGNVVEYDKPEEVWKLWLKKRFLGTTTYKIGKEEIAEQVKSTSSLSKGDMSHYLDQVYHWAMDLGIKLSIPKESEYAGIKNQQES